jgi:hypothetical protein
MNTEPSEMAHELPYDEQIRLAIEASLSQPSPSEPSQTMSKKPPIALDTSDSENNVEPPADSDLLDQLRSIEDEELAAAISESLANHPSEPDPTEPLSSSSLPPVSDDLIDEPTPEQLRQRRLARFS